MAMMQKIERWVDHLEILCDTHAFNVKIEYSEHFGYLKLTVTDIMERIKDVDKTGTEKASSTVDEVKDKNRKG